MSMLALKAIQLPIQWVQGALPSELNGPGHDDHSPSCRAMIGNMLMYRTIKNQPLAPTLDLHVKMQNTEVYKKSIINMGTKVYNNLPRFLKYGHESVQQSAKIPKIWARKCTTICQDS